jgi:ABC-2 type transport system ATP-binding protein
MRTLETPGAAASMPVYPPAPAAVEVRGLCKSFTARRSWVDLVRHRFREECVPVVRDVSLDARQGEFFGLLGPNGAGKTTLFKMISGMIVPDAGTVRVVGFDVRTELRRVREVLAPVVAEERSLAWRLTARQNLEMFGGLNGLRGALLRERVEEVLQVVELADTGTKMVAAFSSGMKQRLLIARALLARPAVLLLDEPTRSLDPVSARRFRRFLREELIERQSCTVLLATHSSEEALELCDRVGVMSAGRLVAVGTTDELATRVGGERYAVVTPSPESRAFAALEDDGRIRGVVARAPEEDGWTPVEFEAVGGSEAIAAVVRELVAAGVPVARCERVKLPLADLIERVVQHSETGADDA